MTVDLDVDGMSRALDRLREIQRRARDVTPAWEALLTWWSDANAEHFASRGRRWADGWEPLAESTVRQKAALGKPLTPLIRFGNLADDLTRRPLGYERITSEAVAAGTRHRAARYHQSGTRRMPRRPLVDGRRVQAEGAATDAVRNWIVNGTTATTDIGSRR